ncbi:MAG: DUF932 domain-containing protein [Lachnospiraceae bacterium]|nr:DUF932 domain-containing protein [Lachnospiraceae bacterium]
MSAAVETMFYVREKPWHGLGTMVKEAPASRDALRLAGLDWNVMQEPVYTSGYKEIPGYKANVRDRDREVLGVVSNRYKVVQNWEAFSFTDELLGEGVRYETAGSLMGGRKVWILAKLPNEYIIEGEQISPYLVFSNTHDGSGAVKVAVTPVRVVCNNTLNLALNTAERSFSMIHTGDVRGKVKDARDTLQMSSKYMEALGAEFKELQRKSLPDKKVIDMIEILLPDLEKDSTQRQKNNIRRQRDDLAMRYFEAPDLKGLGKNAYRFINAVSDYATHAEPIRKTANYQETLFGRTIEGNPMIDKAYKMLCAA